MLIYLYFYPNSITICLISKVILIFLFQSFKISKRVPNVFYPILKKSHPWLLTFKVGKESLKGHMSEKEKK